MKQERPTGNIQVILRAAAILDLFTEGQEEWRFRELVAASGLNKSTVFNIVNTMHACGILEQDEETRRYRLGVRMIRYGDAAQRSLKVLAFAEPHLTALRDAMNETVQLAELDGANTVYVSKVDSTQPVHIYSDPGKALPAYATALGKAMLAYRGREYLDRHLPGPYPKLTERTITNQPALLRELQKVREQGFSCDDMELADDMICFAAPVFDHRGRAAYAISMSTPSYRMTDERRAEIPLLLKREAAALSRELGYRD